MKKNAKALVREQSNVTPIQKPDWHSAYKQLRNEIERASALIEERLAELNDEVSSMTACVSSMDALGAAADSDRDGWPDEHKITSEQRCILIEAAKAHYGVASARAVLEGLRDEARRIGSDVHHDVAVRRESAANEARE
jgi:hypothetical protein